MRRVHLSIVVENLHASSRYYRRLFGRGPDVERSDYQQWLLDEPPLNLSINQRAGARGIDHVGLQLDTLAELDAFREAGDAAGLGAFDQHDTTCCYARSDKRWLEDPDGVNWEVFVTHERLGETAADPACCATGSEERCCA